MLEAFQDGKERGYDRIVDNNADLRRVLQRLIKDGYLENNHGMIRISSEGLVFLAEGGYTHHFIETKRSNYSFWISLISIALAITSFVISIGSH